MKRREFMTLLAGAAAVSSVFCSVTWPFAARAQQPSAPVPGFPNKTLRIIVPFTPGGSNDVVARESRPVCKRASTRPRWSRTSPAAGATSRIPMWRSRRRTVMSC